MTKDAMIEELERQLTALKSLGGEYEVTAFNVWSKPSGLDSAVIRYQHDTWSWGHCQSETCAHNSHDPYTSGSTVFIECKAVGLSESNLPTFVTPTGVLFTYNTRSTEFHYRPRATIAVL